MGEACSEGIFGLHAVLHIFIIISWMLLSILTMNFSNDPSTCVSCVFACVFISELAVMEHWTLEWTGLGLLVFLTFILCVSCNKEVLLYLWGSSSSRTLTSTKGHQISTCGLVHFHIL